jgi:hypothetical protein
MEKLTMPNVVELPLGIRQNNPGNLRRSVGPMKAAPVENGFAHFESLMLGTESYFYLVEQYYRHLGLRTLPAFIERYAPASENDTQAYLVRMCQSLGLSPLSMKTIDLCLDDPWRAMDFARAQFRIESGLCPTSWKYGREWVPPYMMIQALTNTGKWALL